MVLELADFLGLFVVILAAEVGATLLSQAAITRWFMPDLGDVGDLEPADDAGDGGLPDDPGGRRR